MMGDAEKVPAWWRSLYWTIKERCALAWAALTGRWPDA